MWPLESAKTDSDWASTSSCSESSVTDHGSTRERRVRDHSSSARSSTTTSAPCSSSAVAVPDAVDADHVAELPGAPGLDAGQRVLEHRRLVGPHAEPAGALQERVRRGLAAQAERVDHVPVDADLEVLGQAR